MRIGNLHLTWVTTRQQQLIREEIKRLMQDRDTREMVGRIIRGEAKNYLAELAEEAEMPFPSPAGFLRALQAMLRETASAGLHVDPEDLDEALKDDTPCTVTLTDAATGEPLGHADLIYGPPYGPIPVNGPPSYPAGQRAGGDFKLYFEGEADFDRIQCGAQLHTDHAGGFMVWCSKDPHVKGERHESADYFWYEGDTAPTLKANDG